MRNKMRIVPLLTVFVLLMFGGLVFGGVFEDVPQNHWAYDAVDYLAKKGLVEGYPDGTFKGQRNLTRYEFAQVIARAYVAMEEAGGKGVSIDVESIMNDLMEEFAAEIEEIRNLAKENKVRIDDLERKLKENSDKDAELASKLEKLGSKFKLNGAMKLRWQGMYYDKPGNPRKQEPKISFRFDLSAPVNEELTFGGRLATGGEGKANATETTLTNVFGLKAFDLERAYLEWKPAAWPNWKFYAGKFAPQWKSPWNFLDGDINVEGLAQVYKQDNWHVTLNELVPADKGGYIVGQIGANDLFIKNLEAYLSYHFISSGAFETMYTAYPYWFRVDDDSYAAIEAYLKYKLEYMDYPINLEGAYRHAMLNEAPGSQSALNQAAMAQVTIGDIKEINDYSFYINYARILPNAVIPQLADSTAGVDHDTWSVGFDYKLMENTMLKLKFINAANIMDHPDQGFNYICADIVTNF